MFVNIWNHLGNRTGGEEQNPKTFWATIAIANPIVTAIQVLIARRLNLIGTTGTVVLASYAALRTGMSLFFLSSLSKRNLSLPKV